MINCVKIKISTSPSMFVFSFFLTYFFASKLLKAAKPWSTFCIPSISMAKPSCYTNRFILFPLCRTVMHSYFIPQSYCKGLLPLSPFSFHRYCFHNTSVFGIKNSVKITFFSKTASFWWLIVFMMKKEIRNTTIMFFPTKHMNLKIFK